MNLQPDHPAFTAAVLGEAPEEELAEFEAALASMEDETWVSEAGALRLTAHRLRSALKKEPVRGLLSPDQRRSVLAGPAEKQLTAFPFLSSSPNAPSGTRPGGRQPVRKFFPGYPGPVLATAGIAAAIAAGMFALSTSPDSQATAPRPAKLSAEGIPAISLDPGATAQKSAAPAPGLPVIPKKDPVLLPGAPIENPLLPASPESIATTAPDLKIAPSGSATSRNPESGGRTLPPPAARRATGGAAIDNLASPAPR